MNNYKISVILPTYNAERYLERAILSIVKQTIGFENIELVIIDDNSNDNTKNIISKYASQYNNINAIFMDDNSGSPSRGRNIGITKSTGKYILFLDNDDEYCLDACQKLYDLIEKENFPFIYSQHFRKFNHALYIDNDKKGERITTFDNLKTFEKFGLIWGCIYDKNFLIENHIKFPDEDFLFEDLIFALQTFTITKKIIFEDDYYSYIHYVRNTDENTSLSHLYNKKHLEGIINAEYVILDIISEFNELYKPIFNTTYSLILSNFKEYGIMPQSKWVRPVYILINKNLITLAIILSDLMNFFIKIYSKTKKDNTLKLGIKRVDTEHK